MWPRIYEALKAFAALSGVVAFASIAYTFYKDTQIRQAAIDQGWQEAEIYRVVFEAGVNGLPFDQIVSKVQGSYFQSGLNSAVDPKAAQSDAVRRSIVGLASKNSLIVDTAGNYIVPTVAKNYLTQDILFSRMQSYNELAFKLVNDNPGRYNSFELRREIQKAGATEREAWQVVGGGIHLMPPAFVSADGGPYDPNSKLKVLE